MGSAREPSYPAVAGIADQLSHFFDRLAAIPMPEHMVALIDELERTYASEGAGRPAADGSAQDGMTGRSDIGVK